jgi:peptidyl-prolyl cis-trans isomerase SurA
MTDIFTMFQDHNKLHIGKLAAALLGVTLAVGALSEAAAQSKKAEVLVQPAPAVARAKPQLVNAIVAVVNDEVITRSELIERMHMVERRMSNQGAALPPRPDLLRQLLERMILDRAQMQLAKEYGIRVDDSMLDRAVARIAEQNKMSLQDFRNKLEHDGTPFNRFREEIREEIIMQRLREREVDNKIQITDSEVDNFLAAESGGVQGQQEINLGHILVRIPEKASPEQLAARRARAEEVQQQLKGGADFAKLAATYSDAPEALAGGELGWRNQQRLPQLFNDAIASLKPGETSAIVKSANGFHILKLIGKRQAGQAKAGIAAVQQTHVRHILIKVNQVVTVAEARRKLLEIKQRLDNKAAKFEDLAKLFSNDLSAGKGGDLGWIYPGDTVPEFERAMDALKPGQISEPIESPFGVHLIQVLERKTDDVSQERLRMAARQAIRESKIDEATQEWLRQLRDRAYVEYRIDDK